MVIADAFTVHTTLTWEEMRTQPALLRRAVALLKRLQRRTFQEPGVVRRQWRAGHPTRKHPAGRGFWAAAVWGVGRSFWDGDSSRAAQAVLGNEQFEKPTQHVRCLRGGARRQHWCAASCRCSARVSARSAGGPSTSACAWTTARARAAGGVRCELNAGPLLSLAHPPLLRLFKKVMQPDRAHVADPNRLFLPSREECSGQFCTHRCVSSPATTQPLAASWLGSGPAPGGPTPGLWRSRSSGPCSSPRCHPA